MKSRSYAVSEAQGILFDLLLNNGLRAKFHGNPARTLERASKEAVELISSIDTKALEVAAYLMKGKAATNNHGVLTAERSASIRGSHFPHYRAAYVADRRVRLGMGYRPELLRELKDNLDFVEVWEHIVDRFLALGRFGVSALWSAAQYNPVLLHSLSLSVGSADCRERHDYLKKVRTLIRAAGVRELSDHLAFCYSCGRYLPHFAPLWRNEQQLSIVVDNVSYLQDYFNVRIVLENIALQFDPGGDMTASEFSNELVSRTGCGLLLDVTNLMLNHANGFLDAASELHNLELSAVACIHLAGGREWQETRIDSHDQPISELDLDCLRTLLPKLKNCHSVILERDGRFEARDEIVEDLMAISATIRV